MNISTAAQYFNTESLKASDIPKWLLARGISSVSTDDLADLLGIPKNHVPQRMASLRRKNEIISPAHGLWIPIPPEYMTWGAPPAIDIIDILMRHLNVEYYIGWLSAAAIHGASHHAPQVFQAAVSRSIRQKNIGRSKLQFFYREHIKKISLIKIDSKNGTVPVSSRESTLLDIANDIKIVGGINNAANLVIELCEAEKPDIAAVIKVADQYPVTAVRRLGFLMETFTSIPGLSKLEKHCERRKTAISILDPQAQSTGTINTKWNIKINREVSPDV